MRKLRLNLKIDWTSKIIDLFIVIIGITIAFRLNSWNEVRKTNLEVKSYIKSFYDENQANRELMVSSLEFLKSKKQGIDSLEQILLSKNYSNKRIKFLIVEMSSMPDFSPSTITMQNITSSGKFEQVGDINLRRDLIRTYDAYKATRELGSLLTNYGNKYVTPFFFKNVRLSNFGSVHSNFVKDPLFENIVIGYDVLLKQLIKGYERNLDLVSALNKKLTAVESQQVE